MKRLLVLVLLAASLLSAETVFVTAHSKKTYHTHRDCIALTRSKQVYQADEKTAQSHGLTLCGICAHRHHSETVGGNNSAWATPAPAAPAKEAKK